MVPNNQTTRRRALQTITGTLAASAVPSAVTASTDTDSADEKSQSSPTNQTCEPPSTSRSSQSKSQPRSQAATTELGGRKQKESTTTSTGIFDGTVDRIVDDEHVVILVTNEGSTVEEFVEPQEELPTLEEGDAVRALLFRGTLLHVWAQ